MGDPRTIYVTGGYSDVIVVDVAGLDLTGATLKIALFPEELRNPPAAGDSRWVPVTLQPDKSLRLPVLTSQGPGHWYGWLQIAVGGSVVPVRILAADGDPLHVVTI